MKWNFFRVLLMLFLPWRKESESYFGAKGQLNTQEIFEQNMYEIVENQKKFQSVNADEFDDAWEQMQKEIEKEYDEKTDITARKMLDVHEQLINPHIDHEEREELEKEHGYHALIKFAELQHYFDSLLKPIKPGPPILEKKPYRDLMLSLNRKQHTVCINILAKL